jgi:hypothetical protein
VTKQKFVEIRHFSDLHPGVKEGDKVTLGDLGQVRTVLWWMKVHTHTHTHTHTHMLLHTYMHMREPTFKILRAMFFRPGVKRRLRRLEELCNTLTCGVFSSSVPDSTEDIVADLSAANGDGVGSGGVGAPFSNAGGSDSQ